MHHMDKSDLRRTAAAHGLNKLTDRHLEQLTAGISGNAVLSQRLPKDLHWSEESALIFRLAPSPAKKEARR